jgi:hypothetical protein
LVELFLWVRKSKGECGVKRVDYGTDEKTGEIREAVRALVVGEGQQELENAWGGFACHKQDTMMCRNP